MHFEPVLRNEEAVAVLVVGWSHEVDGDGRIAASMRMLAAETAMALERSDLLARLEEVARTDDLTGLLNRRAWEEQLPRELARARRNNEPLCVALLDLDFFKNYNDERGHQAGDRLLKQSAVRLGRRAQGQRHARPLRRRGVHGRAPGLHPAEREGHRRAPPRVDARRPDRLRGRRLLERARVGRGARRPRRCSALRGEAHWPRSARHRGRHASG